MSAPTLARLLRADGSPDVAAVRQLTNRTAGGTWVTYNARATVEGTPCLTLTALRGPSVHDGYWIADVRAENTNNAEFIAAAHELVPALCDRIEALERELQKKRTKRALTSFGERPKF